MKKILLIFLLILFTLSACQHQKQENIPAHRINDREVHSDALLPNAFLWLVVDNASLSRDDAWKIVQHYEKQYPHFDLINIHIHCDTQYASKDALNSDISDAEYYSHVLYSYMSKDQDGKMHFEGVGDKGYYGTACGLQETKTILPTEEEVSSSVIKIKTLSDFENSYFCKIYKCVQDNEYPLKVGGINHDYKSDLLNVDLEASTIGEDITSIGLIFNYRGKLSESDFETLHNLFKSTDKNKDPIQVMKYVRSNIEDNVFQINEAPSFKFSSFEVYAGKVGNEQTVSLERQSAENPSPHSNEDVYRNALMRNVEQISQVLMGATSTAQKVARGEITSSQAVEVYKVYLQNTIDIQNKIKNLNPPPRWQEIHAKTLRAHDLFIEGFRSAIEGLRDNQPDKMDLASSKTKEGAQELQAASELIKALGY